jgi:hypothetical protein
LTPPLAQTTTTSPVEQSRKRDFPEFDSDPDAPQNYTRTVALASRKQLCINDELRTKSKDLDNDCLELMEGTGRNDFVKPSGLTMNQQKTAKRGVHIFLQSQQTRLYLISAIRFWYVSFDAIIVTFTHSFMRH